MASVLPSDDQQGEAEISRLRFMVRAFSHRNYRLFFGGQIVSLCGTFLSQLAVVWLVYRLSGKKEWVLGVVSFAGQIPMFLIAPFAGVWADRLNRQRLLVLTQALSMVQSFALAAVAFSRWGNNPAIGIPMIAGLALFQGLVNAFDMPGRQAFLVEMVTDLDDLPNAIALNSTMVHTARLIGPAIAGELIYFVGEGVCFTLDGFSYLAVIAALLAMRVAPRVMRPRGSVLSELREGLTYIWNFKPIRVLLIVMAILSLTGMPAYSVLTPVFADLFGGVQHGSQMLSFLMAASAVGALCGAVYLASRRSVVGLGRVIGLSSTGLGLALMAFALSRSLWLSLPIVAMLGLTMIVTFAAANTLLQTLTEEHMRGRVMSFFSMAFLGMAPFGSLAAGGMASWLGGHHGDPVGGASKTILIAGVVCIAAATMFILRLPSLRRIVRPIYISKGILPPEAATALQSATQVIAEQEKFGG